MKKILFVFNHPAPYKVRLLNELSNYFDLDVIFERNNNKNRENAFYFETKYKFNLIKIRGFKIGEENFFSSGIVKTIRKNKYDLIIMNGYSTFAEMNAINYMKRKNIEFMLYINGGLIKEKESNLKRKIKTNYISSASWYFSPDKNSDNYLKFYGAKNKKIFNYDYSTIYEKEINSNYEKENNNLGFERVFVSAGQLIRRKNYEKLINLWKSVPNTYALIIFGDGIEKNHLVHQIKTANLKNVILKGFANREELYKYYKMSDGFIFPTKEDIYGHVVNEALSQGLPVISTNNANASKKLVKSGFNGYVLNDLNEHELKQGIETINSNNLRKNCIDTAKENTIEKMVEEHVKYFGEILK